MNSSSSQEPLKRLSADFLNLLANGQAFSDVAFTVEGRNVYAHKCVLAARSRFFRLVFCSSSDSDSGAPAPQIPLVIPVAMVSYDVFMFMLQFLYSGQLSLTPQDQEGSSAVCFALQVLHAAQVFGIEELVILIQEELALMAEKSSIEDAMRILVTARKQDLMQLWSVSSKLIARSGLSSEALAKHLPMEIAAEIEAIRQKCGYYSSKSESGDSFDDQRTKRVQKALDSSDVELVKLMVMEEGLSLDKTFAVHYAVTNCSRKVVRILLELGAADVNATDFNGRSPLHIAAELADPEMISVLLDHHANADLQTAAGTTALTIVREQAFKALTEESVNGVSADHSKLKLCLDLLQTTQTSTTTATPPSDELLSDSQRNEELGFYSVAQASSKDHSPTWSESDEVIDPTYDQQHFADPAFVLHHAQCPLQCWYCS